MGRKKIILQSGLWLFSFFLIALLFSCKENTTYKERLNDPELFLSGSKKLTDVIVHDIFSPPVASRIYAHPNSRVRTRK